MSTSSRADEFPIRLAASKFQSRCRICGSKIRIGEPCFWAGPGGVGVACLPCATGEDAPILAVPNGPQGEWFHLLRFLRDSVIAGTSTELLSPEEIAERQLSEFAGALQDEAVDVPIDGAGVAPVKNKLVRREDSPVSIGWPIVSFTDSSGKRQCSPLFIATVTVKISQNDAVVLSREGKFALNPGLGLIDGIGGVVAEKVEAIDGELSLEVARSILDQVSEQLDLPLLGFDSISHQVNESSEDGIYNAATIYSGDTAAVARLIEELDELADRTDWKDTAAATLIARKVESVAPKPSPLPLVTPLPLNGAQEVVLSETPLHNLTVVTGPPGTGKSQAIVDLVANTWARGESVLLASTNNAAVDVAVDRAQQVAGGLLMRTGRKSARERLPDQISQLVASSKRAEIENLAGVETDLVLAQKQRAEFHRLLHRESVLQENLFALSQLEEDLSNQVEAFGTADIGDSSLKDVVTSVRRIAKFKLLLRYRWKRFARKNNLPLDSGVIRVLIRWLECRVAVLAAITELADTSRALGDPSRQQREIETKWHEASKRFVSLTVAHAISKGKSHLSALGTASSSFYGTQKAIEPALQVLRGWACTTLSLRQNYDLKPAMFDFVLLDEASQCHLAYVIPAAYRARRLIVVGDPNQLPPIPFAEFEQERALARTNSIPPSDLIAKKLSSSFYSSYDFFAEIVGAPNVMVLNEHYRSHPYIARWFNEVFYGADLKVLTDIQDMTVGARAVTWIDVDGTAQRPPKGSWINEVEAHRVVEVLDTYIDSGRSVGVVTPFAGQAEFIDRLATQRLGRERLIEANFKAGTAHRFQGDERDVVVFSPVVAPGISEKAARWVGSERRLINVAASRARISLVVVGHSHIHQFECDALTSLREYANSIQTQETERVWPRMDSQAESRIYDAMLNAGLRPISKLPVEGYELDFGIISGDMRLDIEVDGDQHYELVDDRRLQLRRQDLARDNVLRGVGWAVLRVPAWECYRNPVEVATRIRNLLQVGKDQDVE